MRGLAPGGILLLPSSSPKTAPLLVTQCTHHDQLQFCLARDRRVFGHRMFESSRRRSDLKPRAHIESQKNHIPIVPIRSRKAAKPLSKTSEICTKTIEAQTKRRKAHIPRKHTMFKLQQNSKDSDKPAQLKRACRSRSFFLYFLTTSLLPYGLMHFLASMPSTFCHQSFSKLRRIPKLLGSPLLPRLHAARTLHLKTLRVRVRILT